MAHRALYFLAIYFFASSSFAYSLEFLNSFEIPYSFKVQSTSFGGISGLTVLDKKLWAVSDDRGVKGPYRIYSMEVKEKSGKYSLENIQQVVLKDRSQKQFASASLDLEAISAGAGSFIVSSEGDNNLKPRQSPRIFVVNKEGQWLSEVELPKRFVPESTGMQTRGILNNAGFEGLTCESDCLNFFTIPERSLYQDTDFDNEDRAQPLRLAYWKKNKDAYEVGREYVYLLDAHSSDEDGKEIFRGVSEILFYEPGKILILERGLNFSAQGLSYRSSLYLAEIEGATDVATLESLKKAKYQPVKKTLIADLSKLTSLNADQKKQNYEAMAWLPVKGQKHRILVIASDNNFSKKEKNMFLFFKFHAVGKK